MHWYYMHVTDQPKKIIIIIKQEAGMFVISMWWNVPDFFVANYSILEIIVEDHSQPHPQGPLCIIQLLG